MDMPEVEAFEERLYQHESSTESEQEDAASESEWEMDGFVVHDEQQE